MFANIKLYFLLSVLLDALSTNFFVEGNQKAPKTTGKKKNLATSSFVLNFVFYFVLFVLPNATCF